MKITLALLILGLAACSHNKPAAGSSPTAVANADEPVVDPTLPSWAPRSCAAYHTAVVEAQGCSAIAQSTRDSMREKYEAAQASWKAMHDAPQGTIDEIRASCAEEAKAVHAEADGKCVEAKS
jgi:predicted lipoprotein